MAQEIYINSHFDIIEGFEKEVLSGFQDLADGTRKEEGNLSYILTQDTQNPLSYTVIEHWADKTSFEAHLTTEHFKKFAALSEGKRKNKKLYKLTQLL